MSFEDWLYNYAMTFPDKKYHVEPTDIRVAWDYQQKRIRRDFRMRARPGFGLTLQGQPVECAEPIKNS